MFLCECEEASFTLVQKTVYETRVYVIFRVLDTTR